MKWKIKVRNKKINKIKTMELEFNKSNHYLIKVYHQLKVNKYEKNNNMAMKQ